MTTSLAKARGGREKYWTRERITEAIVRWVELFGEPPKSADWNPSAAKWHGQSWRIERYRAGDPETGHPWPSLNAVKGEFGGSLNAAVEAAGFEASKPGPRRRSEASPEILERVPVPASVKALISKLETEAAKAAEKLIVRERELARAREATKAARAERDAARRRSQRVVTRTKTKTKTVTRPDGRTKARLERALAKSLALTGEVKALKLELAEARNAATRMASKLERAEATITDLRADRRELRRDLDRASDTAERYSRARKPEVREVVREVPVEKVVHLPAPGQEEIDTAKAEAAEAVATAKRAEDRAALAERRYMEVAEAATGDRRLLSEGELNELRKGGPSGPAVMGAALKGLARARAKGGKAPLKTALYEVASAAIRWRERL